MAERIWSTEGDFRDYGNKVYARWIRRANWEFFAPLLAKYSEEDWWEYMGAIAADGAGSELHKVAGIYSDAPIRIAPIPVGYKSYGDGKHYWWACFDDGDLLFQVSNAVDPANESSEEIRTLSDLMDRLFPDGWCINMANDAIGIDYWPGFTQYCPTDEHMAIAREAVDEHLHHQKSMQEDKELKEAKYEAMREIREEEERRDRAIEEMK